MNNNCMKILLVDDEAIIAMAEAKMLEEHGYSVLTAYSGSEAIDAVNNDNNISLILMDIDLGESMDGTEAAEIILKKRNIPLLFLSSHTEQDVVDRTERISSYGYVVKNCGETVLIASIKMAFKLHDAYLQNQKKQEELEITNKQLELTNEKLQTMLSELEETKQELESALLERKQTEEELIKERDFSRAALDSLPGLFYLFNEEGKFLKWNYNFSDVSGYSDDEIKNMIPENFLLESEWDLVLSHIQKVFNSGETIVEAHFREKSGKGLPYLYSGKRLIHDGKPCLVGMGIDISKRKIAEAELEKSLEEKKALLVEVQHRNKNNLSMIASILGLEIDRLKDGKTKNILCNLKGRMQSMSSLNDMLFNSGTIESVYLDEYLHAIISSIKKTYIDGMNEIGIEQNYDHIKVKAKDAASWGLITNEILTNALKYAFTGIKDGMIKISLGKINDKIKLKISDNGIDLPGDFDMEHPDGLGLLMVKMLAKQLGGTLTYDKNDYKSFVVEVHC